MKLALAIIAKDEVEQVRNILSRYYAFFDEICIAVDRDIKKFNKLTKSFKKLKVFDYDPERRHGWTDDEGIYRIDFAHKRNFLASKVESDYYLRLDTDDTIEGIENLRLTAEKALANNVSVLYSWYEYSKDDWGNVHAAHYREALIKNDTNLFWNKPIHENLIPKSKTGYNVVLDNSIKIVHHITAEHAKEAGIRNIKYLLHEYDRDKENTDPRTIAYLGRMLCGIGELDKSQFFLEKHIAKSGWDEDRYMSWCLLADIMTRKGKFKDAEGCCFEALAELPAYPDAYLKLHNIYFEQGDWDKAIYWGAIGMKQEMPRTFMLLDPSSYTWRPALSMAYCYFQKNDFEIAKKLFDIGRKAAPGLDFVVQNDKVFEEAFYNHKYIEHFMWIFNYLKQEEREKLTPLLESVPTKMEGDEIFAKLKNVCLPFKTWDEKSIVFFCGNTPEPFAPPSVLKGIGGSEEAVIYLAREFAKLGYKPTIFGNCGEMEGEYDGVEYKAWYKFNYRDKFNILVSWRNNIFDFTVGVMAQRKIVWLHDLPDVSQFREGSEGLYDYIVVLSQYHKSLLPSHIPDEKICVSTNGINVEDFIGLENIPRQANRIIYTSSYDRGLETILRMWPEVKKEVPEAELHCFYGWNTYDGYVKHGFRTNEFKEMLLPLLNQEGIYEHGRIGHKQLLQEYAKSSIYAYPTNFSGEINCIALTKAIACGCDVVTNDKFVLSERSPHAVSDEQFKDELLVSLRGSNGRVKENRNKYIQDNSWEAVAIQWAYDMFTPQPPKMKFRDLDHYKKVYSYGRIYRPSHMKIIDGEVDMVSFPPRYAYVADFVEAHKAKSVLDVGCADGTLSFFLKSRKKINSEGIDTDERAVKYANEFAKKTGVDCKFHFQALEEFKPSKKYDLLVALEVIEHVIDPKEFLRKAEALVKPGGHIILSTPNKNGFYGEDDFNIQHINNYDEQSFRELIGNDRIVEFQEQKGDIYVVAYGVE